MTDCVRLDKPGNVLMDNFCIGTVQFGMNYGIANQTGQPEKKEIMRIVETASKNGIFYYDTAHSYGASEKRLGEVFSELNITEKVRIVTKLNPDFTFSGYPELKDDVSKALCRLNLKSLWGVLIHRPHINGDWHELAGAVLRLKDDGLLSNFGVSVYDPDDAIKCALNPHIDIIQVPFNILDRRLLDNDFFVTARTMQKEVFIRSVFLQGLLLMDEEEIERENMQWVLPHFKEINDFIEAYRLDLKSFAINAVHKLVPWTKLIIGLETEKQLKENVDLIGSENIFDDMIRLWWSKLPSYPERLVNPALW